MPRRLSSASLSKYLIGGVYYDFIQYVKADKELAFEIRMKDEVMIYCQKNLILRISHRKNAPDNITMLNPRYYTNRKDGLTLTVQLNEPSDLQDIHKVRQYFEDAKALCKNYKSHDEFIVQQQYKAEHSSFDGDYLAIDMEWAPDQAAIPVEYRLKDKTKVDLLVVSNKPNEEGRHEIYLAEVKCGLGAVEGKSGIEDHVRMSQAIINNEYVRQILLGDVTSIIKQKTQLQLFEGTPIDYTFSECPKIMFILANSSDYDKLSFNRIVSNLCEAGRDIKTIRKWLIEYAPNTINDKIAFDVYVEYETSKGEKGVIGIEVKYTEEGYSVGYKEFAMMQDSQSAYSVTTRNSGCFINNDPMQFNNPDFIQLWRNHILGLAMLQQGKADSFDYFDSLTLYPSGNAHFHSSGNHMGTIAAYEELLTDKGKSTFHGITYECFFNILRDHYQSARNISWLDYLDTRYINKHH